MRSHSHLAQNRLHHPALATLTALAALVALVGACNLPDDPPLDLEGGRGGADPNDPGSAEGGFTATEVTQIRRLSPLPAVPPDPTNAYADNASAAVLGQRLFFDKGFSGPLIIADDGTNGGLGAAGESARVACVSCHASRVMDDDRSTSRSVSLGTDYGARNALSILNSSFYKWTNWGGRFDSQWSLALAVAENPKIMNGSRLQIAHLLFDKYRTDYDAIFQARLDPALERTASDAARFPASGKPKAAATDPDGAWERMTKGDQIIVNRIFTNFGKAIAAYIRLNVSRDAPFDRYVAGETTAIDASAKRGLRVFLKSGCVTCHSGPNFSDDRFHNIGLGQTGVATDTGRYGDIAPLLASSFNSTSVYSDDTKTNRLSGIVALPENLGQFRTKGLRDVASSAPYMHAGQLATLEAVVEHYARGGSQSEGETNGSVVGVKDDLMTPRRFTEAEAADLVAFLKTLEGAALPTTLREDTSR